MPHVANRTSFKKGHKINLGKKNVLGMHWTCKKINYTCKGSARYNWKGDDAKYASKHNWVNRNKEKPSECPKCGSIKKLEWCNIDHKYRRVLDDYFCLCCKCHRKYDIENGLRKLKKFNL